MTTGQHVNGGKDFTNAAARQTVNDNFVLEQFEYFPVQNLNLPTVLEPLVALYSAFQRRCPDGKTEFYIGMIFGLGNQNGEAASAYVETLAKLSRLTHHEAKIFANDVQMFIGPDFGAAADCIRGIVQGNLVEHAQTLTQKQHRAFSLPLQM